MLRLRNGVCTGVCGNQGLGGAPGQNGEHLARPARLHREPHPHADDQRGILCAHGGAPNLAFTVITVCYVQETVGAKRGHLTVFYVLCVRIPCFHLQACYITDDDAVSTLILSKAYHLHSSSCTLPQYLLHHCQLICALLT